MKDGIWEKFYLASEKEFEQLPNLTIGKLRECINQIPEIYNSELIKIVSKSKDFDEVRPVKLIDDDMGLELYTTN